MKRALLIAFVLAVAGCQAPPDVIGPVEDFTLTDTIHQQPIRRDDLKGKVWLGAFIFTRCGNSCPQFTAAMVQLQKALAQYNDFVLVSITIDPEHDTPEVLRAYAQRFHADTDHWLFLTGDRAAIHQLSEKSFKLGLAENQGTERSPGNEFMHMPRAFLVDKQGQVRGYFDLRKEDELVDLRKKVPYLAREKP